MARLWKTYLIVVLLQGLASAEEEAFTQSLLHVKTAVRKISDDEVIPDPTAKGIPCPIAALIDDEDQCRREARQQGFPEAILTHSSNIGWEDFPVGCFWHDIPGGGLSFVPPSSSKPNVGHPDAWNICRTPCTNLADLPMPYNDFTLIGNRCDFDNGPIDNVLYDGTKGVCQTPFKSTGKCFWNMGYNPKLGSPRQAECEPPNGKGGIAYPVGYDMGEQFTMSKVTVALDCVGYQANRPMRWVQIESSPNEDGPWSVVGNISAPAGSQSSNTIAEYSFPQTCSRYWRVMPGLPHALICKIQWFGQTGCCR